MIRHLSRIAAITLLLGIGMVYPFLPGSYDGSALAWSTMIQLLGVVGLILVPIGTLWLGYQMRPRAAAGAYYFAIASLVAAAPVAALTSLAMFFAAGRSLGLMTVALWSFGLAKLVPKLKRLREPGSNQGNPTPWYLTVIPIALLLIQLGAAPRVTELSRGRAIANSAQLIAEIEAYHAVHDRYPSSLLAVWKDYSPAVVAVERYHYAPQGDAYSLVFEQPRFLLDAIGTREFVMYNKVDQHVMPSHAAWILAWSPEQLAATPGWYAVHDASSPHWKSFWFD